MAKVLGVALAVRLDVLAVSVGVGVMQLVLNVSQRLGFAFAGSEIAMQVIGYELAKLHSLPCSRLARSIACRRRTKRTKKPAGKPVTNAARAQRRRREGDGQNRPSLAR